MRGKIVNLCMAAMNVLMGIFIFVFTITVEQDKTLMTVQEALVADRILIAMYIIMALVISIDLYQWYTLRRDISYNVAFFIGVFVFLFIFIRSPFISIISIVSGILILVKSMKENLVEIDSTFAISAMALIMAAMVITTIVSFFYQDIAQNIKEKEDKDLLKYTPTYFKYITELEIEDVYINVKRDGKYGYINQNGEVVIDFIYDYASPFVEITMYNKDFHIALVCLDGNSTIILKNRREVMAYRSESEDDNYAAKIAELNNIYTNILNQPGEMVYEVDNIKENMLAAKRYEELSNEYTYRYDYNSQYDIIVTKSNLGLGDTYELARKNDLSTRILLECDAIDYDDKYVYLFKNGSIPYYDVNENKQGWITENGRMVQMDGRAQILEFIDHKILIRDYSESVPWIYFIDESRKQVSDKYKDIYIHDDRYIVKDSNNRYQILDKEFNRLFNMDYDFIDTSLVSCGLYVCMNTSTGIEFNDYNFAKMDLKIMNFNGDIIVDNVEQVYSEYYEVSNDKTVSFANRYNDFLVDIRDIEYKFVGDKFYEKYLK